MKGLRIIGLSLIMAVSFAGLFTISSNADEEETVTIEGNVVCLIPNYKEGNIEPVIATEPCDTLPPHQHVIVTKNKVYSLQGLQEGLKKIEQNPERTNVKIAGKVKGSDQTGWILFVE